MTDLCRFLANYTSRVERPQEKSQVLSPQDTLNESQRFKPLQRSPSSMSESSTINVTHNQQRHDTEGNASSQLGVITPLQRTYTGQTLRTTTADSDSESTIVHTLSNEHDLLKEDERLVEGSSDKSQPQSRQSHDRSMCTKNMIHSKHTRPGSSTELRGQRVQSPSRSTLSSSVTATSCRTTASEAEFRSDLASLDADIARLQMQFRVATLTKLPK